MVDIVFRTLKRRDINLLPFFLLWNIEATKLGFVPIGRDFFLLANHVVHTCIHISSANSIKKFFNFWAICIHINITFSFFCEPCCSLYTYIWTISSSCWIHFIWKFSTSLSQFKKKHPCQSSNFLLDTSCEVWVKSSITLKLGLSIQQKISISPCCLIQMVMSKG